MNGYFQLVNTEQGSGIRLFPPTEGGEPVGIREIMDYLSLKGITYDTPSLNSAVVSLKGQPIIAPIQMHRALPQQEMCQLYLATDKMSAMLRLYAPSTDGNTLNKNDIIAELNKKGIVFGIREDVIDSLVKQKRYCENIVVAVGIEPVQGRDAVIEYFFNTNLKVKPTLNEDGSVDFFNLNTINHCTTGDVLARLFPEDLGKQGKNVVGEVIMPREVKRDRLQFGRNITLSEDKTTITADVNGHVTLVDGRVFVSDLFEVENVDNSTGNIEYEGSVVINGNVCSNFSVKARGNIEVRGVVEGAYLEAGGDIIIARGVNGIAKGVLKAGGNVIAKFIENATVIAGGYVESGSILHSKVMARTEVTVNGRKGFITGGVVSATCLVNVKTLGSPMGASTIIEVGVDPEQKSRYQELQKQSVEAEKVLRTVQPVITATVKKLSSGIKLSPVQLLQLKELKQLEGQKQEELKAGEKEMESLREVMEAGGNAQVVVTGEVFPGVKISISDVSMVVQDNMKYCKFIKLQGDVKMTGI